VIHAFNTEPVEASLLRIDMVGAVMEEGITVNFGQAAIFNALLEELAREPSVVKAFYLDQREFGGHCRRAIRTALFDPDHSPSTDLLDAGRKLRNAPTIS
jgi:hypothetical protein